MLFYGILSVNVLSICVSSEAARDHKQADGLTLGLTTVPPAKPVV